MWELWSQGDMPLEDQFSSVDEVSLAFRNETKVDPTPRPCSSASESNANRTSDLVLRIDVHRQFGI